MAAIPLSRPGGSLLTGITWRWLGRQPFGAMVARNRKVAEAVAAGAPGEVAFFEPAEPVYALGRRAQEPAGRARIADSLAACAARQIAIVAVDRGGLATLHAPGQIVAFLALPCPRWQVRQLCDDLLHGIERLAQDCGVEARSDLGEDVGVWIADGKLASLGLRLRDDVAQHGVAMNIAVDRRLTEGLVLCGKPTLTLANLADSVDVRGSDLPLWCAQLADQWQLRAAVAAVQESL